jgi:hypothetical protein
MEKIVPKKQAPLGVTTSSIFRDHECDIIHSLDMKITAS